MVVVTNVLELGINIPNIQAIIYMDGPWNMRDFRQESRYRGWDR